MNEEDKLKLQVKMDEMKKKRGGKALKLDVTVSSDHNVNFVHALNEIKQLFEMHKLIPDEAYMLVNQLQWQVIQIAQNANFNKFAKEIETNINNMFSPKEKTHEDKENEKHNKEVKEGTVRVKPGE